MARAHNCTLEELEHTAEIGLRVRADSLEALFACAALALFRLMEAPDDGAPGIDETTIEVHASDLEGLLVDWLSEIVFYFETTGRQVVEVEFEALSPVHLAATLRGTPLTVSPRLHIKGVTWHGLRLVREDGGWLAEVYLDI